MTRSWLLGFFFLFLDGQINVFVGWERLWILRLINPKSWSEHICCQLLFSCAVGSFFNYLATGYYLASFVMFFDVQSQESPVKPVVISGDVVTPCMFNIHILIHLAHICYTYLTSSKKSSLVFLSFQFVLWLLFVFLFFSCCTFL